MSYPLSYTGQQINSLIASGLVRINTTNKHWEKWNIANQNWDDTNILAEGDSISSIQYGVSASADTEPTSWQSTIPVVSQGQFLWNKITWVSGLTVLSYARQGVDGTDGEDGDVISAIEYGVSASVDVEPTTWTSTLPTAHSGEVLWTRTTWVSGAVEYSYAHQGIDGSGAVDSVNGQTGNVVLDADDISDTSTTNQFVTSTEKSTWSAKQDALVSGTNIKTINSNSILGSGNIDLDGLPSQSGQSGKYLTTDGSTASWGAISAPTYTAGTNIDITNNAISVKATLPVSVGGTGATTLTSGYALIGNGTGAVQTRAITDNTSRVEAGSTTNIPTCRTVVYHCASWTNRGTSVSSADTNYTTYIARGESLNANDTTPAQNGQIAWTYQ